MSKLKINMFFALFILYATAVILAEYLYLLVPGEFVVHIVLSIVITAIAYTEFCKKHVDLYVDFSKSDLIPVVLLISIYLINVYLPECGWDTINYHIVHQAPFDKNQIFESFFSSSLLHTFLWPLGDRLGYVFRYFLGFRLGTIFNLFVVICIYYMCKDFLHIFWYGRKNINIPFAFCAFAMTVMTSVFDQYNSYLTDIRTVPILIYFADAFVNCSLMINKNKIYFLSYLLGIEISIKISAAVLPIAILVILLLYSRKSIKTLYVIKCVLLSLLSIAPYCYEVYVQTSSPIFPFYNSVFKSPYFAMPEYANNILGDILQRIPASFLERLLKYPFADMLSSQPYQSRVPLILVVFGVMVALFIILRRSITMDIRSRKLAALVILCYLAWASIYHSFLRYDPLLEISCVALILDFSLMMFSRSIAKRYVGAGLVALVALQTVHVIVPIFVKAESRPPFYRYEGSVKNNIRLILHDNQVNAGVNPGELTEVRAWMTMIAQPTNAYMQLLKPDIPVIGLDGYIAQMADVEKYKNPIAEEIYNKLLDKYLGHGLWAIIQSEDRAVLPENILKSKNGSQMGYILKYLLEKKIRIGNIKVIHPDYWDANKGVLIAEMLSAKDVIDFNDTLLGYNDDWSFFVPDEASSVELYVSKPLDKFGSIDSGVFAANVFIRGLDDERVIHIKGDGDMQRIVIKLPDDHKNVNIKIQAENTELMALCYQIKGGE